MIKRHVFPHIGISNGLFFAFPTIKFLRLSINSFWFGGNIFCTLLRQKKIWESKKTKANNRKLKISGCVFRRNFFLLKKSAYHYKGCQSSTSWTFILLACNLNWKCLSRMKKDDVFFNSDNNFLENNEQNILLWEKTILYYLLIKKCFAFLQ